jgi:hypothetical protein
MATYRGIVKDGVIVLEGGARLPEGVIVEVRVMERQDRIAAIDRLLATPIDRPIGMDEILAEDRREREERYDEWFGLER